MSTFLAVNSMCTP